MIDIEARKKAEELLHALLSRGVSNYRIEDDWPAAGADRVLPAIHDAIWAHYDDYPESLLTRSGLPSDVVDVLERCVLFLGSGLEYQWPEFRFSRIRFRSALLEKVFRCEAKYQASFSEFRSHGDFDVWPFVSRADYDRIKHLGTVVRH